MTREPNQDNGYDDMAGMTANLGEHMAHDTTDTDVDVTAERTFARHLAYRLLDDMAAALLDGRTGSVAIPRLDPEFAAITGRSLQLIADTIKTSPPMGFVGKKQSPDVHSIRACSKDQQ